MCNAGTTCFSSTDSMVRRVAVKLGTDWLLLSISQKTIASHFGNFFSVKSSSTRNFKCITRPKIVTSSLSRALLLLETINTMAARLRYRKYTYTTSKISDSVIITIMYIVLGLTGNSIEAYSQFYRNGRLRRVKRSHANLPVVGLTFSCSNYVYEMTSNSSDGCRITNSVS